MMLSATNSGDFISSNDLLKYIFCSENVNQFPAANRSLFMRLNLNKLKMEQCEWKKETERKKKFNQKKKTEDRCDVILMCFECP